MVAELQELTQIVLLVDQRVPYNSQIGYHQATSVPRISFAVFDVVNVVEHSFSAPQVLVPETNLSN